MPSSITHRTISYLKTLGCVILPKPIPGTVCVGLLANSRSVKSVFEWHGQHFDVSESCVIWSLQPLLFAIPLFQHGERISDPSQNTGASLIFSTIPEFGSITFGKIELRVEDTIESGGIACLIASVRQVADHSVSKFRGLLDDSLNSIRNGHNRADPKRLTMNDLDLKAFSLFYSIPRPVVLVSVSHDGRDNLFPMDLIGPLAGRDAESMYSLALRLTSPAIDLMLSSRKFAIATIPIEKSRWVYGLGSHHKKRNIDWAELETDTISSAVYGLRLPDWCLDATELSLDDSFEQGSHRVFLCSMVSSDRPCKAAKMHHMSGRYDAFQRDLRLPLRHQ